MSRRMQRAMRVLGPVVVMLGAPASRGAAQGPAERPVSESSVRPLTTDRPGNGENPFTVNPGHVQFEFNALGYTRIGSEAPGDAVIDAGLLKARVGITSRVEAQLLFNGYQWTRPAAGEGTRTAAGFGGRLKLNLVGADDEGFSLGVIPAVSAVHGVDGEWSAAWSLSGAAVRHLPAGLVLGATVSATATPVDGETLSSGFAAIGVSRVLVGPIGAMVEFTAIRADLRVRETEGRVGGAIIAALSATSQLDLGIDAGLTHGAAAYRIFFGAVRRF